MQLFNFTPVRLGGATPYEFEPVLDGQGHTVYITWNIGGQRWYMTLVGPDGTAIFHMAVMGSPIGVAIESLEWIDGEVRGKTVVPTAFRIGDTLDLVVADCVPARYNGRRRCLITGTQTFSYLLSNNPGLITNYGTMSYEVDHLAGYGYISTLVYRDSNRQFEVRP